MKALNKLVETPQLTSDLGGTFMYSHPDWLQFYQVLKIYCYIFLWHQLDSSPMCELYRYTHTEYHSLHLTVLCLILIHQ